MKIINETFQTVMQPDDINFLLKLIFPNKNYTISNLLFFDIETTGFSAQNCICYLIGYVYYKNNCWNYCQLLAELPEEETQIINQFSIILKKYTILAHFNGDGFDIPFLNKRIDMLKLNINFSQIISMDLYKYAKKAQRLLKLEQYKQKNIEIFMGFNRTDHFGGGDLIHVYTNFTKKHLLKENTKEELSALLLHNKEDICALPLLSNIILYCTLPEMISLSEFEWSVYNTKDFSGNITKELLFTVTLPTFLPTEVSYGKEAFYIKLYENILKLRIKLYCGELRHFYKNYKDYYYLPSEDIAVHKSVSFYVDKNYRIQAKASTCYSRKEGIFIPQTGFLISPEFIKNISDKESYFELTKHFLNDKECVKNYIKAAIKGLFV